MRHEAACGGSYGKTQTEVFNRSGVVSRAGKSENKDDSKGNRDQFQEILYLDAFIFSNFAVQEYRNGKF